MGFTCMTKKLVTIKSFQFTCTDIYVIFEINIRIDKDLCLSFKDLKIIFLESLSSENKSDPFIGKGLLDTY